MTIRKKVIRKTFMLIIMIILISSITNASKPVFNYNIEIGNDITIGEDKEVGELSITKQDYESEKITTNQYNNITLQRYDGIRWEGENTIEIRKSDNTLIKTLFPNSTYYFQSTGEYYFLSTINQSRNASINVLKEDDLRISYYQELKEGNETIDSFTESYIVDTEKIININTNLPHNSEPGLYDLIIIFNSSNQEVTKDYELELLTNKSWNITMEDINTSISIESGKVFEIGRIDIKNTGNSDYTINSSITGNGSSFINSQSSQDVLRGMTTMFNIVASVPLQEESGNYVVNYNLGNNNISKSWIINIKVTDSNKPVIENISFSNNWIKKPVIVRVVAKDNVDVTNVTMSYDNKTIILDKDGYIFNKELFFNNTGLTSFDFCAFDGSGNKVCEKINKSLEKLDLISKNNSIDVYSVKKDSWVSQELFFINHSLPDPFNLSVISLDIFDSDRDNVSIKDFDFRLKDSDGDYYDFELVNNSDPYFFVELPKEINGSFFFELRNDFECDYEGKMVFNTPSYHKEVVDTIFSGRVIDYSVPRPFSLNFFGNQGVTCEVVDTGRVESSRIVCPFEYPITTAKEDISIPVTVEQKELTDQQYNATISEKEDFIDTQNLFIFVLVFVVILVSLFAWFSFYYKKLRWKFK